MVSVLVFLLIFVCGCFHVGGDPAGCSWLDDIYYCSFRNWNLPLQYSQFSNTTQVCDIINLPLQYSQFSNTIQVYGSILIYLPLKYSQFSTTTQVCDSILINLFLSCDSILIILINLIKRMAYTYSDV